MVISAVQKLVYTSRQMPRGSESSCKLHGKQHFRTPGPVCNATLCIQFIHMSAASMIMIIALHYFGDLYCLQQLHNTPTWQHVQSFEHAE